jgi:hypothetical protein
MANSRWRVSILLAASLLTLGAVPALHAADLKYLPDDTEVVITVNFRQILTSELVKAQKEAIAQARAMLEHQMPAEAQKWLKKAGFDLFKDLDSVTIALPATKQAKEVLVVVDGSFQAEKLYGTAEEAAGKFADVLKVTKAGEHKIVEVTPPEGNGIFVSLVGKNVLLAGSTKAMLTAALSRASGDEKPKLKKEMLTLLETTNAKQSISAVASGKALAKLLEGAKLGEGQLQAIALAVQAIDGLSAAITITKDLQFQVGIGTKDTEIANNLAKGANFAIVVIKGVVTQKAKEDQKLMPLVDIVNTLRVTTMGSSVIFRGEASLDNIDKLIKNFQQPRGN